MSRILCAWEIGGELGHLGQFSIVINELLRRGHEVFFAAKDLSRARSFFDESNVIFLQAPVWIHRLKTPMQARIFSEILLYQGYQSSDSLLPLTWAWRNLFNLVKPDLVIFDCAPTALLAAVGFNCKKVILSNSFMTPPEGSPPVDLRCWDASTTYDFFRNEKHVVAVLNQVAATSGVDEYHYVSELFKADKVILNCFKEIDFYRTLRKDAIYLGSLPSAKGFQKPGWRNNSYPKVFAYLKFGVTHASIVLEALSRMPLNVLCFYSGAKPDSFDGFQSANVYIDNQPFDLDEVFQQADVAVCHGGMGIVTAALYAGCPMVLIPTQLEQINTSIRLVEMKVAVSVASGDDRAIVEKKLEDFFSNPQYLRFSQAFSSENQLFSPTTSLKVVGDICDDLLKKSVDIAF